VSFFGAAFWSAFFSGSAWAGVRPSPSRHAPTSPDKHHNIIFCIFITCKRITYFGYSIAIISLPISARRVECAPPFLAFQHHFLPGEIAVVNPGKKP
jgi:hypothetical protein